jgi:hypothetical protein
LVGDATLSTGNLVVSNGKGIDFSATPGTGTSELLADYEEGTFTPTAIGSGTAGTPTYTTQTGTYTKIGNTVNFRIYVASSSISGSPTGNLIVGGLPFTSASDNLSSVSITILSSMSLTAGYVLNGFVDSSQTRIDFRQYSTSGTTTVASVAPQAVGLIISGQYKV